MRTTDMKPRKIPGYFSYHWEKNGLPTGSWWQAGANDKPKIHEGFFAVYHPEQEIEITMLPCIVEHRCGFASEPKAIDLSQYVKIGHRLSLSQRLKGFL